MVAHGDGCFLRNQGQTLWNFINTLAEVRLPMYIDQDATLLYGKAKTHRGRLSELEAGRTPDWSGLKATPGSSPARAPSDGTCRTYAKPALWRKHTLQPEGSCSHASLPGTAGANFKVFRARCRPDSRRESLDTGPQADRMPAGGFSGQNAAEIRPGSLMPGSQALLRNIV